MYAAHNVPSMPFLLQHGTEGENVGSTAPAFAMDPYFFYDNYHDEAVMMTQKFPGILMDLSSS